MNAERLLAHYEEIADAPDAIPRLRRFVLDLAVRGKLVPQDASDEPASELLKRIAAEKARLVKAGEIRKPPAVSGLSEAEIPFVIPRTWAWVRVGEIFDYDAGIKRQPKELIHDRWLLELEDIEKDTSIVLARLRVRDRDSRSTKSEFAIGDILYGKLRPYLNKVVVADEPGYSTTEIVAIRPYLKLCPEYCALAFRRPDFVAYVECLGQGTKMPRLRTPDAIAAAFPLPPLAEQHRIVAKVDELMALCDRLQAARQTREATRDKLTAASLARLNVPDPETFKDDARFALDALPALTARADQIKHVRQTILNLAVRGKLVPQDASDEPALELLKRISKERVARVRNGELREAKGLAPPSPEEQLFTLPRSWEWSVADQLWDFENGDRSTNYPSRDQLVASGIPFINAGHLVGGRVSLADMNYITPAKFASLGGGKLRKGDQIYCLRGSLGKHAIFDLDCDAAIASSLVILRPVINDCVPYLSLYLNSDVAQIMLRRFDNGSAQPNLSSANLRKYEIPIPPLAEQHRIVAKVDELMALCDRLEASLANADETRRRLLEALLAEALSPAEDRELEAAE